MVEESVVNSQLDLTIFSPTSFRVCRLSSFIRFAYNGLPLCPFIVALMAIVKGERPYHSIGIINTRQRLLPAGRFTLIKESESNRYYQLNQVQFYTISQVLLSVFIRAVFWVCVVQVKENESRVLRVNHQHITSGVLLWKSILVNLDITKVYRSRNWATMAQTEVEYLVVHLEGSLEISSMENGVKLIGDVLADQQLNKWGVKNILRSSWREYGEA